MGENEQFPPQHQERHPGWRDASYMTDQVLHPNGGRIVNG
jgi:hypothetical protein